MDPVSFCNPLHCLDIIVGEITMPYIRILLILSVRESKPSTTDVWNNLFEYSTAVDWGCLISFSSMVLFVWRGIFYLKQLLFRSFIELIYVNESTWNNYYN